MKVRVLWVRANGIRTYAAHGPVLNLMADDGDNRRVWLQDGKTRRTVLESVPYCGRGPDIRESITRDLRVLLSHVSEPGRRPYMGRPTVFVVRMGDLKDGAFAVRACVAFGHFGEDGMTEFVSDMIPDSVPDDFVPEGVRNELEVWETMSS